MDFSQSIVNLQHLFAEKDKEINRLKKELLEKKKKKYGNYNQLESKHLMIIYYKYVRMEISEPLEKYLMKLI